MGRIFSFQHLQPHAGVDGGFSLADGILPDGTWVIKDILVHAEQHIHIIPSANSVSTYLLERRAWTSGGVTTIQQQRFLFASRQPFAIIWSLESIPSRHTRDEKYPIIDSLLVLDSLFDISKKRATFAQQIDSGLVWREYSTECPHTLSIRNTISSTRNGRYCRLIDLQPYIGTYAADIWDIYMTFYDGGQIIIAKSKEDAHYGEALLLAKGTSTNIARHALEPHCHCMLHRAFGDELLRSIWIPQEWAETILCLDSLGYVPNPV